MNNYDEILVTLLKAKEKIALYTREKVKNKDFLPFYNGLVDKFDNIIEDYTITTKIPCEDIMNCYFEVGADHKDSIFYDDYMILKHNI